MCFHRLRRVVVSVILLGLLILTAGLPSVQKIAFSQNPLSGEMTESDDIRVLRQGDWALQSTDAASGGAYLYNAVPASATMESSSANVPALTLNFTGSSIEILYVEGPSLGIMAVEVDGVVLRTLITAANTSHYQQHVVIDYLSDEAHTLRVYPTQGTIAIDAFVAALPSPDTIAAAPTCPPLDTPQLIGYTTSGGVANPEVGTLSFSADGRYVAFVAGDIGLVANDTNGFRDIFVRDMQTCTTEIISVSSAGSAADGFSMEPEISADGRYVAFLSGANNLVPVHPTPPVHWNVYVRDRLTNTTTVASVSSNNEWGNYYSTDPAMSADGRFVAFVSHSYNLVPNDTNGFPDVFLRDRQAGTLSIISGVSQPGNQYYDSVGHVYISGDGNWIAYESALSDLVANDTNAVNDVFLYDRVANQTTRISMAYDGTQSNGRSYPVGISADGQYVLIQSQATNLVANDTNLLNDAFVYNRATGQIQRVSVGSNGEESNAEVSSVAFMSGDGRYVAFNTKANNMAAGDPGYLDVFIRDLQTGQTRWASSLSGGVSLGADVHLTGLSPDGQWLGFDTIARLHVDDSNTSSDSYIVPTAELTYEPPPPPPPPVCPPPTAPRLVTLTPSGQISGTSWQVRVSLSDDGRYVAFNSDANDLTPNDINVNPDVFVRDMTTCVTEIISITPTSGPFNYASGNPLISSDGRYVSFTSAGNHLVAGDPYPSGGDEVFIQDRQTGVISLGSMGDDENWGNQYSTGQAMSDDGRYIAFISYSNNLVPNDTNACGSYQNGECPDVFLRDMQTGVTTIVSRTTTGGQVNGVSSVYMSGDGNWIVYSTDAADVVAGDTNNTYDVFLVNRVTSETTRISVASDGTQANDRSTPTGISADGRYIVMSSIASNLVPNDSNYTIDVFVYDRVTSQMRRVSVDSNGVEASHGGTGGYISNDGRYVAFVSSTNYMVAGDSNNADTFIHDLQTGHTMWVSSNFYGLGAGLLGFSGDGQWIAVITGAGLHPDDTNDDPDVYMVPMSNFPYQPPQPPDRVAVFNPSTNMMSRVNSSFEVPFANSYITYPTGRTTTGQWVMGDWDGDGRDTPAQFRQGAMIYTNDLTTTTNWVGIWLGPDGYPVAGRFDATVNHDCVGVVHGSEFPPLGTGFALYFTCDLTSGITPPLDVQWLSVLLPTNQGFTGTHQFSAGDFDGDGVDTIAARRGRYIAWTNVPPTELLSIYDHAQYFRPVVPDDPEGYFVVGDWDWNGLDSFGYYYPDGYFYFKRNLDWNEGNYEYQRIGLPVGTPATVASWRYDATVH